MMNTNYYIRHQITRINDIEDTYIKVFRNSYIYKKAVETSPMKTYNDDGLKEKIEILRKELNSMVSTPGKISSTRQVLRISKELDHLILQYYRQHSHPGIHTVLQPGTYFNLRK